MFQKIRQQSTPGHYWDLKGNKQEGDLQIYCTTSLGFGTFIKFSQNGGKRTKITRSEIKSFVIGVDSFTLITDFKPSNLSHYNLDFAEVINVGAINLYIHHRKVTQSSPVYFGGGAGVIPTNVLTEEYIINTSETKTYQGIYNRLTFKNYFLPLIKDHTDLHAKVLAMKPRDWIGSLGTLLAEYNTFKRENP